MKLEAASLGPETDSEILVQNRVRSAVGGRLELAVGVDWLGARPQ